MPGFGKTSDPSSRSESKSPERPSPSAAKGIMQSHDKSARNIWDAKDDPKESKGSPLRK